MDNKNQYFVSIEYKHVNKDGKLVSIGRQEIINNQIHTIQEDAEGRLMSRTISDANGKVLKQMIFNKQGRLIDIVVFKYKKNGEIIKQEVKKWLLW